MITEAEDFKKISEQAHLVLQLASNLDHDKNEASFVCEKLAMDLCLMLDEYEMEHITTSRIEG